MNATDPAQLRKLVYALFITVAAGTVAGRILGTELVLEPSLYRPEEDRQDKRRAWPVRPPTPMPTFGSNDRSRWATVRALVDEGTYAIGYRDRSLLEPSAVSLLAVPDGLGTALLAACGYQLRVDSDRGIIFENGWQSVDKVLHPGKQEYYSSKPPLFSTLVAGLYWLLKNLFGWTMTQDVWAVVRTILLLVNWLPMLLYLGLLAKLVERFGTSDWGRFYVLAAACFATLVTPFAITLNNHNVATYCVVFALYPALRIWSEGRTAPRYLFALSGLFAAFTVCNELPAASFAACLFLLLLVRAPGRTLAWFVPAAALPLAAFLWTNYQAVGQLRPAYSEFGSTWYEYEGSHWSNPKQHPHGIDFARNFEDRFTYAFHVLLGHHGLFSLTPIWIFAVLGMIGGLTALRRRTRWFAPDQPEAPARALAGASGWSESFEAPGQIGLPPILFPLTLLLTLVVIGFYLVTSDNYGGWTSGLRWLMWLSPLWLLCMLPVADWLAARRWGRGIGYVLLALSVLSVSYSAWNPWRHPWLYRFLDAQGLIPY